jgi:acyl-CoA synthetase (AMP-forming)/AMP-acid ligase II
VQLTNANLLAFIEPCAREYVGLNQSDVGSIVLPMFHLLATSFGLTTFYAGGKNVILRDTVPAEILRLIAEQRITVGVFVPALILFLLQTPGIAETDLSSLRLIVYGASPIPFELLRKAKETFKCKFVQGYGMTELSCGIAYLSAEDHESGNEQRLRSCGKAVNTAEMRVVDEEDNELPVGEVGEIIVRSPQIMKGYWNLPEETAQTIRGEWLYTGDAGYFDADGYLYIHDRVKDMIISGGENIYPAEIENALFGHPAVADVAVIGVPDDEWGEAVKAIIVKKPGIEVADTEIIAFAQERIARFKAPKSVDFVDAIPRNPTGKILKRQLREPYWQGRERRVN